MDEKLILQAVRWLKSGRDVAICTVVDTWGSSPRPVGSQLIVNDKNEFQGSVSGGCIESAIITEAQFCIQEKKPKLISIGVDNNQAWEYGLACGGTIEIYIDPICYWKEQFIQLSKINRQTSPFCLVTDLKSGEKTLIKSNDFIKCSQLNGDIRHRVETAILTRQSYFFKEGKKKYFLSCFTPQRELIIGGAVHIAQPLTKMANLLGYDCTVIDSRTAYATKKRFPESEMIVSHPKNILKLKCLHPGSAVVALSHSPQFDDPLLIAALKSNVNYIGALGSRTTHTKRIQRLLKKGCSEAEVQRIHGPVGMDIGSKTPAEIALSIMAQITQTNNRKGVKNLGLMHEKKIIATGC